MEGKQKLGIFLIVAPIVIAFLIALVNGFRLICCWTGSYASDWFWGIVGLLAIVVGLFLVKKKKEE